MHFGSMKCTLRHLTLMLCTLPLIILPMNSGFYLKKLLSLPLKEFMLDSLNHTLNLTSHCLIGFYLTLLFNLIMSFIDRQLVCLWDHLWHRLWLTYSWLVPSIMFSNMGFLNILI